MDVQGFVMAPRRSGWRWLVVAGTVAAAAAHVPEIGSHLVEAPYMGVAFVVLTGACLALAAAALAMDSDLVYVLAELSCGLAIAGYIVTRLVAFPLLASDVGNWLEPLGVVSVLAEGVVVGAAMAQLCRPGPPRQPRRPSQSLWATHSTPWTPRQVM